MMEWDGLNPLFQQGVFYAYKGPVFGRNILPVLKRGLPCMLSNKRYRVGLFCKRLPLTLQALI